MYPPTIQNLIKKFSKFPTIGPRTAARFVFYLIKLSGEEINELIKLILELKEKVKLCEFCFNPFSPPTNFALDAKSIKTTESNTKLVGGKPLETNQLCQICSDPGRDKTLLCVVEKESDLQSLEKTKKYKGFYFILGGTVSALKKKDIEKLRIKELEERIKNPEKFGIKGANFQEIILALNPTTEGEATALYLERMLKPLGKKITRLGRGLPIGGELEYADEETLSSALEGRR